MSVSVFFEQTAQIEQLGQCQSVELLIRLNSSSLQFKHREWPEREEGERLVSLEFRIGAALIDLVDSSSAESEPEQRGQSVRGSAK